MTDPYEDLRRLFMQHEYRPHEGGYKCRCGWEGSSQAEHMADVVMETQDDVPRGRESREHQYEH